MDFETFELSNGLRVIHRQTNGEVGHCGIVINAGSRDELEHQQGLAHFIEHCIFKGTEKRKTYHILSRLDSVGGEINAYTTKEETWVYASFLSKHLERAIELVSDICFHSVFPQKEIEKERDVIVDEIHSYLDAPDEMILDDFEDIVFEGHPIGRNILGTVESVQSFGREDILEFTGRCYRAQNIVLSSSGPASAEKLRRLCEKHLSQVMSNGTASMREPFTGYQASHREVKRDTFQVHYVLGTEAYPASSKQKTGLVLLNNLLGGPAMNSRLNLQVRERHGIAYNIESGYQPYSDTGLFHIYLGTDERTFSRAKKLVQGELRKLREKKLGTAQLHMAKQQLIGQIALSQESGAGTMIALGKSYLAFNRVDTLEEVYKAIESITAESLLEIANELFEPSRLSSLTYLPRSH